MRTIALRRGLAALLVAALSYGVQADEKSANTLRIGYQKYGTLVLLKARGTLEKRLAEDGVKVQWTEFPGGPQLLEGLNVGSIDFGVTGETPPVFAQAAGADLLYVAYEPPAPTSEAILLPKDSPIRSVAELKGRKVALNKGSNVHYLLVRALEQAGLKYSDIQPVYLPPADARAAFERHSVDAWVIWDPTRPPPRSSCPRGSWWMVASWSTTTSSTSPPGLTRNGIRRCSTSWWTRSARSATGRGPTRSR